MSINEIEAQSVALPFAYRVMSHFESASISVHKSSTVSPSIRNFVSSGLVTVTGFLNLSHGDITTQVNAQCAFYICDRWQTRRPSLRCFEPWVRGRSLNGSNDANWHLNRDGSVCYVLNDEWKDSLASEASKGHIDHVQEFAAFYAINNARWLLYRHLEGYRRKLSAWDSQWPQWQHNEEGQKAYQVWKKRRNQK